jgi:hypothetical protein
MGARWYHSELGRFMSPDPVGFNAGNTLSFNRYLYGNNNPYTFYDPDGEYAQLVIEMTEDAIVQVSGVINDIKNGNYESAAVSVVSIGLAVLVARRLPGVSGLLRQGAKNSDKVIRAVAKSVAPNAAQAKNLKRFQKKIPSNSKENVELRGLPNNGVAVQATSAGKVPGSRAVYEKQIDVNGKTIQATKTTYNPQGNIVHVKDKLNGGTYP